MDHSAQIRWLNVAIEQAEESWRKDCLAPSCDSQRGGAEPGTTLSPGKERFPMGHEFIRIA